ncbi:unnamed protein product [Urochloa humidicola]
MADNEKKGGSWRTGSSPSPSTPTPPHPRLENLNPHHHHELLRQHHGPRKLLRQHHDLPQMLHGGRNQELRSTEVNPLLQIHGSSILDEMCEGHDDLFLADRQNPSSNIIHPNGIYSLDESD